MFIQSLEGLSKGEGDVAIRMKDKELHKHYKGLSNVVKKKHLVGMTNTRRY